MKGESRVTIICSEKDRASQNIKNAILSLRKWNLLSVEEDIRIFEYKDFRLVEIKEPLIFQDGLDKRLSEIGYPASLLIFASKHRSKDMRSILTVHSTGNVGEAKFGGSPGSLSSAAPQAVRSLFRSLKMFSENEGYEVTLECTHHGPTDIDIPSVFVEIGSSEAEWIDETAGRMVAESILLYKDSDAPVAVGFGGTHYAPRQTALILSTDITFGHIFPSHALDGLNEDIMKQAFARSRADFAYFDRKSMKREQRERLSSMIEAVGFEVLKESDIKEMDGVPWEFCIQLRKKAKEICPSGKTVITEGIKCALSSCQTCVCPRVKIARINPGLLSEAEKLDKDGLREFLSEHNIAYIEYGDGRFAHILIGIDDSCARIAAEELKDKCVEIIKKHYDVSQDNEILHILDKKFSPELAKSFGVVDTQLFGRLARGESVVINGKTINPEMVYETNKRAIKLN